MSALCPLAGGHGIWGVAPRDWNEQLLAVGATEAATALAHRHCALLSARASVEETAI